MLRVRLQQHWVQDISFGHFSFGDFSLRHFSVIVISERLERHSKASAPGYQLIHEPWGFQRLVDGELRSDFQRVRGAE